ncbi:hypothetical protein B0H14DRAFT_3634833 [Mycena olivaceomarginata]|nr:hypothetical protein B0H14DRAFT_3634833 [Mycena olivaceomarginata]
MRGAARVVHHAALLPIMPSLSLPDASPRISASAPLYDRASLSFKLSSGAAGGGGAGRGAGGALGRLRTGIAGWSAAAGAQRRSDYPATPIPVLVYNVIVTVSPVVRDGNHGLGHRGSAVAKSKSKSTRRCRGGQVILLDKHLVSGRGGDSQKGYDGGKQALMWLSGNPYVSLIPVPPPCKYDSATRLW